MKYLSDYMQAKQTEMFNKYGVFFAFSNDQVIEGRGENAKRGFPEDTKLCNLGGGMICPSHNAKLVASELDRIWMEAVAQDLMENGKEAIIVRELYNHECFYTGNWLDVVDSLSIYNITKEEVLITFRKELPSADC